MPKKPKRHSPSGQQTRAEQKRSYDQRRNKQEWRHWYWTAMWRRIAKAQLQAEPLCANCLKQGRYTPATVCDHIEPHRGDAAKFWGGPFQSLCDAAPWRCHSKQKQREEGGGASNF